MLVLSPHQCVLIAIGTDGSSRSSQWTWSPSGYSDLTQYTYSSMALLRAFWLLLSSFVEQFWWLYYVWYGPLVLPSFQQLSQQHIRTIPLGPCQSGKSYVLDYPALYSASLERAPSGCTPRHLRLGQKKRGGLSGKALEKNAGELCHFWHWDMMFPSTFIVIYSFINMFL